MSSVRPSSSKNQEDDEVSEVFEVSKALERSKFQGVDFTNTVPKVFYESTQGSPSPSDMRPSFHRKKDSVGVIKSIENFTPDNKKISKWWNNPNHALKKAWYVDTYTKDQRISFSDKWFKDMKIFKTEIEFFKWFECSGQIDETNSSLQVLFLELCNGKIFPPTMIGILRISLNPSILTLNDLKSKG